MRNIIFLLLIIVETASLFAQRPQGQANFKPINIIGTVIEEASGNPLEFTTVSVFSQKDSSLIGGGLTDDKGMFSSTKSKIIIKNPNKKQLVIEDGKVIEGGEDYSAEELEKIKNEHRIEMHNSEDKNPTSIQGFYDLRDDEGMKNFKNQFQNLLPKSESVEELNAAKDELIKAKEELIKAREELQKANQNSNKATIQKKKVNYKRPY